jgi:hypothetical protein
VHLSSSLFVEDREGPPTCSWKDELVWNPFFAARGLNRRRRRSGSPWGVSVREEGARLEEVYPERKLCHVPCVIVAVAGADAVFVSVSRLPATGTRSGVHSRPSWGFLTSKIVPKDVPSVGHRMPPGSIAPRTLRSWGRWSLASDVTSLQSLALRGGSGPFGPGLSWGSRGVQGREVSASFPRF